ncbi:MAG: transglutaminase-like domain-containing protein [Ruminococcus sp.]
MKEVGRLKKENDRGIRFYRDRLPDRDVRKGYAAGFLLLLCFVCGAEGILYALDFVLFLNFQLQEAAAVTAAVCLVIWLAGVPKGRWRILSWPLAAAGCVWIYRYMKELPEELAFVYRTVKTNIWELTEHDVTKTVILFTALCALLLFLLTYVLRMAWLFLIISVPMVFLGPLLGQKLDILEICLLVVFHAGTWILGAGHRRKRPAGGAFAGAFLTLGLFLIFMGLFYRTESEAVDGLLNAASRIQEEIHQLSVRVTGKEQAGGVNRGNQASIGQEKLEIVASERPEEILYLKDFTGSRYMGEYWEIADESEFLMQQGIQNGTESQISRFTGYADEDTSGISVQVRDLAEGDEVLLPVEFSPFADMERGGAYGDYAAENYMEIPVGNLPQLVSLCEEYPLTDYDTMTDHILTLIQKRMSYSRTPGQVPLGRDTIEYYMFERGEGYCQHFATAAALMYRIYGVPSRYVTGYIARPSQFSQTEEGFRAVVTDENAHAWTEIYLPGQGWERVEATPPGSVVASPVNPLEAPEEPQGDVIQNETVQEGEEITPVPDEETETETQEEERNQRDESAPEVNQGHLIQMIALPLLAFLVFLLLAGKILAVRRRELRKRYPRWRADRLYAQMMEVLHFGGFFTEYDGQEKKFAQVLSDQISSISLEEAQNAIRTALLSAYGNEVVSRKQRRQVFEIYRETCLFVLKHLRGLRKLYFQYVRGYW